MDDKQIEGERIVRSHFPLSYESESNLAAAIDKAIADERDRMIEVAKAERQHQDCVGTDLLPDSETCPFDAGVNSVIEALTTEQGLELPREYICIDPGGAIDQAHLALCFRCQEAVAVARLTTVSVREEGGDVEKLLRNLIPVE